jgi:plasmid stability protein
MPRVPHRCGDLTGLLGSASQTRVVWSHQPPINVIAMLSLLYMASITIRKLEDDVKSRLRVRAAIHGRSMEEEAREILKQAVAYETKSGADLAQRIRRHIDPLGGVELAIAPRQLMRRPPNLTQ